MKPFQSYLKGHSGLVTAMSWSADDSILVSSADDGSLYEWDISNQGKRVNELVIKSCSYSDVVLTSKYAKCVNKLEECKTQLGEHDFLLL